MPKLVALELTNGQELFDCIAELEQAGDAFCVLDSRDSPQRRELILDILAPTHLRTTKGTVVLRNGRSVSDGDGAVVITSGTSGRPKAAVLTWDALRASAALTNSTLASRGDPIWWANLTPVHIGGLAVYLRCLFSGTQPVFAASVATALEKGATHVSVVRTQLARDDYSGFDVVLLGGGPPPAHVPTNVVTTYGMTETGSGIVYDGHALPNVAIRIVDGEIHISSPTLLRMYRDGDDPTYFDASGSRWFATGDGGALVNDTLSIFGRQAYVITTGGEKVWPEDIENVVSEMESLRDVAVIGLPDPEWGQRVVMACVTSANPDVVMQQVKELVRSAIGPWAVPKEIQIVDEIPRTSNGKIARRDLEVLVGQPTPPVG